MTKWGLLGGAFTVAVLCADASAQPVTTYGTTDVTRCSRKAMIESGADTAPCDLALDGTLTQADREATLVNRGVIHRRNGRLQKALDDFNAALDLNPENPEAYLNRGTVFYAAGDQARALRDYEKSLQLGTVRPWAAWYNIGLSYEELKDFAMAREAHGKALAANATYAPPRLRLANLPTP